MWKLPNVPSILGNILHPTILHFYIFPTISALFEKQVFGGIFTPCIMEVSVTSETIKKLFMRTRKGKDLAEEGKTPPPPPPPWLEKGRKSSHRVTIVFRYLTSLLQLSRLLVTEILPSVWPLAWKVSSYLNQPEWGREKQHVITHKWSPTKPNVAYLQWSIGG